MSFTLKIEPEWNVIKQIKEKILHDPQISAHGRDFQDQTLLTAIELVENGLKYSEGPEAFPVEFRLDVSERECVVEVRNRTQNQEHLNALRALLEKIQKSDPFQLYVERLEQVKDKPDGFSRMGLIRIVYEGEYELSAEIVGDSVTLRARRPFNGKAKG